MKHTWKFLFAWALGLALASPAFSQVAQSAHGGEGYGVNVFGEFSFGFPNFDADYLRGVTAGAYYQPSHWIGAEVRGAALHWGPSQLHQDSILFGPRVQHPLFRKLSVYGSWEPGFTHVLTRDTSAPGEPLQSATKFAWQAIGGADYRVNRRFEVRLGEFSYGKIYVLQNGLNPKSFSAGVVYHLF